MRYLSILALALIALHARSQTFFSHICKQYDTTTYTNPVAGYCYPVQRLTDGSFFVQNIRGQVIIGLTYFNFQLMKADSAFRPQKLINQSANMVVALNDCSIGSLSNENNDTTVSGLAFMKMDLDGNYVSAKVIHCDWSLFFAYSYAALPGGIRLMTTPSHIPDTAGSIAAAPFLIDLDNNGYVTSADSIHINGVPSEEVRPYRLETDDFGNSVTFIYKGFGTNSTVVSKLAPDRTVLWSTELNSIYDMDPFTSVQLSDGSVILGNNFRIFGDSAHSLLIKLSPSGALVWQKESDIGSGISSMKLLPNGNILLINGLNAADHGWWIPHGGKMITEIDSAGHVIWSTAFKRPFTGTLYTGLSAPYIKSANEWNFVSNTSYPYMVSLFNTDSNGHSICEQEPISIAFADTNLIAVTPAVLSLNHVSIYSVSSTNSAGTTPQGYDDGCIYDYIPTPLSANTFSTPSSIEVFPNPATDHLCVRSHDGKLIDEIAIVDVSGRVWLDKNIAGNDPIDVSQLPQGYYTVRVTTSDHTIYYSKLAIIR